MAFSLPFLSVAKKGIEMKVLHLFASLFFFMWAATGGAANITCTASTSNSVANSAPISAWTSIDKPYELPPVNVVIGRLINDYTILYQVSMVQLGIVYANCTGGAVSSYYTLIDEGLEVVNTIAGDIIYKTSTPGIGISIANKFNHAGGYQQVKPYPNKILWSTDGISGVGNFGEIKIWKIPGAIPLKPGPISFTGPKVATIAVASGANNIIGTSDRLIDSKAWIGMSRIISGSATFISGTCELEGGHKQVQMGTFTGGSQSPWVDASFKLKCPNAFGYGGSAGISNSSPFDASGATSKYPNKQLNGPVRLQLIPRHGEFGNGNGIINLDGTGPTGYGIQLAWGDVSAQGTGAPARPVPFNQWILANSLNAAYRSGNYAINLPAITAGQDGTIKMAARFVRTSGTARGGSARAIVELIASYD
jgi:hypothetical protein